MKKFADYIKENQQEINWPSIKGYDLMGFYSAMKSTKTEKSRSLDEEFKRELSEKIENFFQENNVEIDTVKVYRASQLDFSIHFKSDGNSLWLAKRNGLFSQFQLYIEIDSGRSDMIKTYSNLKEFFNDYHK